VRQTAPRSSLVRLLPKAGKLRSDYADDRVDPEQLQFRPPEALDLLAVAAKEVEGGGQDASPSARPDAGTGIAVGREGEEGTAPAVRAVCRSGVGLDPYPCYTCYV
jgi:hypothetical protein